VIVVLWGVPQQSAGASVRLLSPFPFNMGGGYVARIMFYCSCHVAKHVSEAAILVKMIQPTFAVTVCFSSPELCIRYKHCRSVRNAERFET